MLKLLEWIKKIHQKYRFSPTVHHPNEHVRFDCFVTSGGAIGALDILFSQTLLPGEVVIVPEFLFPGAICCVRSQLSAFFKLHLQHFLLTLCLTVSSKQM